METIKAKTKLEALKTYGCTNIYWKGNTPYGYETAIYSSNIYAIKVGKGLFYISKERVN